MHYVHFMILIGIAGILIATVAGGDLIYAGWVKRRYSKWEARVERGPDGVRRGAEAFTVGEGRVAILFVHGFGSSPAVFGRMAPALAARGYTCRAMRLPGFGEPVLRFSEKTRDDWREALAAEMTTLRRGHDRVWIVAHSMGGTLSLDALSRNPEFCDGLVLIAPLVEVSRKRSLGLPPELMFRMANGVLRESRVLELCFPVDAADPEVASLEGRDVFVPREAYVEMFRLLRDVRRDPPSLSIPTLAMVSRRDRVTDGRAAADFVRHFAPSAKILHADRAGHVIPLDHGWSEAARQVDEFIFNHER